MLWSEMDGQELRDGEVESSDNWKPGGGLDGPSLPQLPTRLGAELGSPEKRRR